MNDKPEKRSEIGRVEWIKRYRRIAWNVSFIPKDEMKDAIKAYAKWDGITSPEECGRNAVAAKKARHEEWEEKNKHREKPRVWHY